MTPTLHFSWRVERARWQFACGLLGGWLTLAMVIGILIFGWVTVIYGLVNPFPYYGSFEVNVTMAALGTSAAFLCAIVGIIVVFRDARQHALLRLAPTVRPLIAALIARLALFALLCLVPAVALRTLSAIKAPDSLKAVISLADVTAHGAWSQALILAFAAIPIVIAFGWLRAPLRFVSFPLYVGAMQWSGSTWLWVSPIACVLILVGHRIWLRTQMADVARVRDAERREQLNFFYRFNSWRLQRAARATGDGSSSDRVSALLATRRSVFFTVTTVFAAAAYIAVAPAFFDLSAAGWFFAYLVVAVLASPTPIPLGQVMLLPLGAERRNVGRILMNVWVRDVRFRLLIGVMIGLLLRTYCWWLDIFSFMRPPFAASGDEMALLLWRPLMNAVGLYGAAFSLCWTMSASPRLLARAGVLAVLPMVVGLGFTALGTGIGWLLGQVVPALNTRAMSSVRFIIVNGAVFPLLAWWINRQLRPEWLQANIGAISAAMQAWAARRQAASRPI